MTDLVWPSGWMVIPIIVGSASYFGTTILKDEGALKHLQPIALHTIAGILIGIFSILVSSNWSTVVAAALWAILLPPLAHCIYRLIIAVLSWAWNALGGRGD